MPHHGYIIELVERHSQSAIEVDLQAPHTRISLLLTLRLTSAASILTCYDGGLFPAMYDVFVSYRIVSREQRIAQTSWFLAGLKEHESSPIRRHGAGSWRKLARRPRRLRIKTWCDLLHHPSCLAKARTLSSHMTAKEICWAHRITVSRPSSHCGMVSWGPSICDLSHAFIPMTVKAVALPIGKTRDSLWYHELDDDGDAIPANQRHQSS